MMAEPLTLYKLIVLYMLENVNFPLTNGQLSSFILEQGYTTYFTLQQAINELLEAELIAVKTVRNSSQYQITESGTGTLDYFQNKIPSAIRQDIDDYLRNNQLELRNEAAVKADYYKNTNGEYSVHCVVKERKGELIDLTVTVPDRKQAIAMCDHWEQKCQKIYQVIMEELQ
ncbi:MAG: DUF4364 family protein [Eubacteriales bacterium]|nr:DUF4364 family protein [Eubacteriales bacterium]